jgi:hypothetical protein
MLTSNRSRNQLRKNKAIYQSIHNFHISSAALFGFFLLISPAHANLSFGNNAIVNGDAESGSYVSGSAFQIFSTPGWTIVSGSPVVERYADGGTGTVAGGNLNFDTPGPASRGALYFVGGGSGSSSLSQTLSVLNVASTINAGTVSFTLSGWLGGYYNQDDRDTFSVTFYDVGNNVLGTTSIGPVFAADRSNATGMLFESTTGNIPVNTTSLKFTITATQVFGFNNGAADNLSFVATVPEPSTLMLLSPALAALIGMRRRRNG